MDLAWCPVCDKQTFAMEILYCSEACRKKDASSILDKKSCYEFPRRSSQKPYQSPYQSPIVSLKLYPIHTITDSYSFQSSSYSKPYMMASSPSDLLLHGMTHSPPAKNQYDFLNNPSIMKNS